MANSALFISAGSILPKINHDIRMPKAMVNRRKSMSKVQFVVRIFESFS